MRRGMRVVVGVLLLVPASVSAREAKPPRNIRHLGQTSYVRAVTLHAIDAATSTPKLGGIVTIPPSVSERLARVQQASATQVSLELPALLPPQPGVPKIALQDQARIDAILKRWEQASASTKTATCDFYRFVYDRVFDVEKRSKGKLAYIEGEFFRIDIERIELLPDTVSKMRGKDHVPYKVEVANPESWIFSKKEILVVDHLQKTIDVVPVPGDLSLPFGAVFGRPFSNAGQIYFGFGTRRDEVLRRFDVSIQKENANAVHLLLRPGENRDKEMLSELHVMLNAQTYQQTAVKQIDPAGNLETIYVYQNWRTSNQKGDPNQHNFEPEKHPGYKRNRLSPFEPQKPMVRTGAQPVSLPEWSASGRPAAVAVFELLSARPLTALLFYAASRNR